MTREEYEEYLRGKLAFAYCCYGPRSLRHLIRLEFQNSPEEDLLFIGAFLKFEGLIVR